MGNSVATNALGNVFVTGNFLSDSLTFGYYTLTNTRRMGNFLAKYDSSGIINVLWAENADGTDTNETNHVAIDASGNVYITGDYHSPSITFGTKTITNSGGYDGFLVKYNTFGNVLLG